MILLWAQTGEAVTDYGLQGAGALLLLYLLRRWSKQRDDALAAAEQARKEEEVRCDQRVARLEDKHAKDMAEVQVRLRGMIIETNRLRRAFAKIIPTIESAEVRAQATAELWVADTSDLE